MTTFNKNLLSQEIILTSREDRGTGEFGFVVNGTPCIDYPMVSLEGALVAHDLLEHVNGVEKIGSIDDEIEALAGIWFVRGQHGELRRDAVGSFYSPEQSIAFDIQNMGRIYNDGVNFRTPVPETTECDYDETWEAILTFAREGINDEMDEIDNDRLDYYFESCLHYLRAGWAKVVERYNDDAYLANRLFWAIAEAADPLVKDADCEGQELLLSFDIETMNVNCHSTEKYYYVVVTMETEETESEVSLATDEDHYMEDDYDLTEFVGDSLDERDDNNGDCIVESIMEAINDHRYRLELPATDAENYIITFEYLSEYI